jgi:ABC-type transport system involved in cytochrome bd biosynthesis fused ATPase/permease subunit
MSSFLAMLQLVGGIVALFLIAKAVKAAVGRQFRQVAWLAPIAVVLWVTCVGVEVRYAALTLVLIVVSFVDASIRRRRSAVAVKGQE